MGRSPFRVGSILSETLTAEPTRAVALQVCRHGLQIRRWQGAPAQLPALSANNPLQDGRGQAMVWPHCPLEGREKGLHTGVKKGCTLGKAERLWRIRAPGKPRQH